MGELQTDQQIGTGPIHLMLGYERLPQAGQLAQVGLVDEQLVGIGPAVVAHRHRLPAPDQLRAARAEPAPAPQRQLARAAIRGPVPAFHRQDRETVAGDGAAGQVIRPRQRCARTCLNLDIERQSGSDLLQMPGKFGRCLQCCHAAIASHVTLLKTGGADESRRRR